MFGRLCVCVCVCVCKLKKGETVDLLVFWTERKKWWKENPCCINSIRKKTLCVCLNFGSNLPHTLICLLSLQVGFSFQWIMAHVCMLSTWKSSLLFHPHWFCLFEWIHTFFRSQCFISIWCFVSMEITCNFCRYVEAGLLLYYPFMAPFLPPP